MLIILLRDSRGASTSTAHTYQLMCKEAHVTVAVVIAVLQTVKRYGWLMFACWTNYVPCAILILRYRGGGRISSNKHFTFTASMLQNLQSPVAGKGKMKIK